LLALSLWVSWYGRWHAAIGLRALRRTPTMTNFWNGRLGMIDFSDRPLRWPTA
jgi:hypothetical protein